MVAVILLGCIAVTASAEDAWAHITRRNELRIGWGDQLFETLMWHNPTSVATTMPTDYRQTFHEDHRYFQHVWLEYQWRFKSWLSVGGMIDASGVSWNEVTRNGAGQEVARDPGHYFYNVVLMPTVRFTYFHHPNVNLYSGLGVGFDINGGTESSLKGRRTEVGAAIQMTVFGVSANYDRWFCAVDLGGLTALQNGNAIFMAVSRMINVSIGARF